jgi:hypothetical protein
MRRCRMHPRLRFFFFWVVVVLNLYLYFLNVFWVWSPQVPNVFLNMFPMALHFYPISFTQSCPLFTYLGGERGGGPFFCLENKNLYFDESPKLQFFFKELIKMAHCKSLGGTHN